MNFYSLNKKAAVVDFKEAAIRGQAPDKGLYFPDTIPHISKDLVDNIESRSNEEIGFDVIQPFVGDSIKADVLFEIVSETINFPIPLVKLNDSIYSLELFHGPTLAFKDVGARFMSRCLGYFVEQGIHGLSSSKKITVLVATSGDTGGAVASGFYHVEGVEVIILYPSGKVSPVQEKQLTALGQNIHALEVEGSFDDCQDMVKQAFADTGINEKLFLTSANSINVARWLPQQIYYFLAYKQWPIKNELPVVSVPSGNFGNICAGILAMQRGLPLKHFIAACNANDVVTEYLVTGKFQPKHTIATLSNAMDVGHPSNFVRILELFNHQFPDLKAHLSSSSYPDNITMETISAVHSKYHYILDPHGAIGFKALEEYSSQTNEKGFFLETAHPVKFPGPVEKATSVHIDLPANLEDLMKKEKKATAMPAGFKYLKEYLMNRQS